MERKVDAKYIIAESAENALLKVFLLYFAFFLQKMFYISKECLILHRETHLFRERLLR